HVVREPLDGAFLATRTPLRKEVRIGVFTNFQFYSIFFHVTLNSWTIINFWSSRIEIFGSLGELVH
ncbi:MAG: hypothetical protein ACTSUX_12340, partial [Promethearchaeota archaeon]